MEFNKPMISVIQVVKHPNPQSNFQHPSKAANKNKLINFTTPMRPKSYRHTMKFLAQINKYIPFYVQRK